MLLENLLHLLDLVLKLAHWGDEELSEVGCAKAIVVDKPRIARIEIPTEEIFRKRIIVIHLPET